MKQNRGQSRPINRYAIFFEKPERFKLFSSVALFLVDNFRKLPKKSQIVTIYRSPL